MCVETAPTLPANHFKFLVRFRKVSFGSQNVQFVTFQWQGVRLYVCPHNVAVT